MENVKEVTKTKKKHYKDDAFTSTGTPDNSLTVFEKILIFIVGVLLTLCLKYFI